MLLGARAQDKGGFAERIRYPSDWVFRIPDGLAPADAAPLLCAGITTFSPLKKWVGRAPDDCTVAIVGVGGLGHIAVQIASKMPKVKKVIAVSRSTGTSPLSGQSKKDEALAFGADEFLASTDPDAMAAVRSPLSLRLPLVPPGRPLAGHLKWGTVVNNCARIGRIGWIGRGPAPYERCLLRLRLDVWTGRGLGRRHPLNGPVWHRSRRLPEPADPERRHGLRGAPAKRSGPPRRRLHAVARYGNFDFISGAFPPPNSALTFKERESCCALLWSRAGGVSACLSPHITLFARRAICYGVYTQ